MPFARSGRTFGDRGGQLGLVRAWIGDNAAALTTLLRCHSVVYGEWLRRHTVPYDALPDWLVVLDLRRGDGTLVAPGARDEECAYVGLTTPPALFVGTLGDLGRLRKLVGRSRFGSESAEGAVLRGLGGSEPRPVATCERRRTLSARSEPPSWLTGRGTRARFEYGALTSLVMVVDPDEAAPGAAAAHIDSTLVAVPPDELLGWARQSAGAFAVLTLTPEAATRLRVAHLGDALSLLQWRGSGGAGGWSPFAPVDSGVASNTSTSHVFA